MNQPPSTSTRNHLLTQRGFSVFEMVVVFLVIGLLGGAVIPTFQRVINQSHDAAAVEVVRSVVSQSQALSASDDRSTFVDDDLIDAVGALPSDLWDDDGAVGFSAVTNLPSLDFGDISVGVSAPGDESAAAMVSRSGNCAMAYANSRGQVVTRVLEPLGDACRAANSSEANPVPETPGAPMCVPVSATAGDRFVRLDWTPGPDNDIDHYEVMLNGSVYDAGVADTETQYTVTGLTNGTEYSFTVFPVDRAGQMAVGCSPVLETPVDNIAPLGEIVLSVTDGPRRAALGWTSTVTDDFLSGFRIERRYNPSSAWAVIGQVDTTDDTFIDLGPQPNGLEVRNSGNGDPPYQYRVSAFDTSNNLSDPSNIGDAYPTDVLLPPPPVPVATGGVREIELTWDAVGDPFNLIDGYRVYSGAGVLLDSVAVGTHSWTDTPLGDNETRSYKITTYGEVSSAPVESPYSDTASATTALFPSVPSGSAEGGTGQITVTRTDVDGASFYEVELDSTTGTTTTVTLDGGELQTVHEGLGDGSFHDYRVRACSQPHIDAGFAGCSSWSSAFSAWVLPGAPTVIATEARVRQVPLAWILPHGGITGLKLYRSTSSSFPGAGGLIWSWSGTAGTNPSSTTNLNLSNGRNYYYWLVASNPAGDGPADVDSARTMGLPGRVSLTASCPTGILRPYPSGISGNTQVCSLSMYSSNPVPTDGPDTYSMNVRLDNLSPSPYNRTYWYAAGGGWWNNFYTFAATASDIPQTSFSWFRFTVNACNSAGCTQGVTTRSANPQPTSASWSGERMRCLFGLCVADLRLSGFRNQEYRFELTGATPTYPPYGITRPYHRVECHNCAAWPWWPFNDGFDRLVTPWRIGDRSWPYIYESYQVFGVYGGDGGDPCPRGWYNGCDLKPSVGIGVQFRFAPSMWSGQYPLPDGRYDGWCWGPDTAPGQGYKPGKPAPYPTYNDCQFSSWKTALF